MYLSWVEMVIFIYNDKKIYTRRNLFFNSTEHLKYMEMYLTEAFRFHFTADDRPNFIVNWPNITLQEWSMLHCICVDER